jgi:hypothetical protein
MSFDPNSKDSIGKRIADAANSAANEFDLDKLDERLIQLIVEYPAMPKTRIAKLCSITKQTLYNRMKKPSFKRALEDLQKNAGSLLSDVQTAAMRRLRRLIQSSDETIALNAVKLALAPVFNQSTVNVNNLEERIYRVQFGEGGQMFQETIDVPADKAQKLKMADMLASLGMGMPEGDAN